MTTKANAFRALPLAVVLFAAAGCPANTPPGEVPFNPQATAGDIHVRQNQQFEDIPVPYGFKLRRDQLFSYQGRMFRYGTFVYEGLWRGPETRNFYRQQMPVHGWQFVDIRPTTHRDGQMAVFTRDQETAEVAVRELPNRIRVEISVRNNRYTDPLLLARASRELGENPPPVFEEGATGAPINVGAPPAGAGYSSPVATTPYTPGYAPSYAPGYASGTGYTPDYAPGYSPVATPSPGGPAPLRPGSPPQRSLGGPDPYLPDGLGIQMR